MMFGYNEEVEFVDILVQADLGCEDEPATVGVMECPHRLVELVALGVPRDEDAAVVGLADLDSGNAGRTVIRVVNTVCLHNY